MDRRSFIHSLSAAGLLPALGAGAESPTPPDVTPVPVSATESVLYESPDPASVYAYSPGLAITPSGRLIATMEQGGRGANDLPGIRTDKHGKRWKGKN